MASACAVRSGERPIILAAAAAAPKTPERGRGVPARLVVDRVERASELGLDLDAGDEGHEQRGAGGVLPLCQGERGGQDRHRRVTRQRLLHVIVVEGVRRRPVRERGVLHRGAEVSARDRGLLDSAPMRDQGAHARRRHLGGPGQHHAQGVEDRPAGRPHRRLGELVERLGGHVRRKLLDHRRSALILRAHVSFSLGPAPPGPAFEHLRDRPGHVAGFSLTPDQTAGSRISDIDGQITPARYDRQRADPARRRSKRLPNLADAQALLEVFPELASGLSAEERARLDELPG